VRKGKQRRHLLGEQEMAPRARVPLALWRPAPPSRGVRGYRAAKVESSALSRSFHSVRRSSFPSAVTIIERMRRHSSTDTCAVETSGECPWIAAHFGRTAGGYGTAMANLQASTSRSVHQWLEYNVNAYNPTKYNQCVADPREASAGQWVRTGCLPTSSEQTRKP
jgi:hypothetical protein